MARKVAIQFFHLQAKQANATRKKATRVAPERGSNNKSHGHGAEGKKKERINRKRKSGQCGAYGNLSQKENIRNSKLYTKIINDVLGKGAYT